MGRWFAIVCRGIPWFAVVCHGLWWFAMVCRGLWWFAMVCRGLPWFAMICYDLPWFAMVREAGRTRDEMKLRFIPLGLSQSRADTGDNRVYTHSGRAPSWPRFKT
ncbi:hypothetical protein EGW08_021163 [Elysia chlorotica]|uniref:Uncharacterized protein n=1 Tax=Elysia chlorotica TaxID=188477 RepID=A0A3S0Z5E6_ELYCH|nr:hypothetical protein EGW08_021163 [Elysia chlorotica]